mmetsp:Transcript_32791/g.68609  ORF Transcript_32791/g.68609 Transcript_32791/m.68609 type:complete len:354 (+) Transcript_32791:138-1199(+)
MKDRRCPPHLVLSVPWSEHRRVAHLSVHDDSGRCPLGSTACNNAWCEGRGPSLILPPLPAIRLVGNNDVPLQVRRRATGGRSRRACAARGFLRRQLILLLFGGIVPASKAEGCSRSRHGLVPGGHDHAHVLGDPPGRSAHRTPGFLEATRQAVDPMRHLANPQLLDEVSAEAAAIMPYKIIVLAHELLEGIPQHRCELHLVQLRLAQENAALVDVSGLLPRRAHADTVESVRPLQSEDLHADVEGPDGPPCGHGKQGVGLHKGLGQVVDMYKDGSPRELPRRQKLSFYVQEVQRRGLLRSVVRAHFLQQLLLRQLGQQIALMIWHLRRRPRAALQTLRAPQVLRLRRAYLRWQ